MESLILYLFPSFVSLVLFVPYFLLRLVENEVYFKLYF
jgi:hypothetical protein